MNSRWCAADIIGPADEAKETYKNYFTKWEEKSANWLKANPKDPRRWEVRGHELALRGMRQFAGLEEKTEEEVNTLTAEILAADDAGLAFL